MVGALQHLFGARLAVVWADVFGRGSAYPPEPSVLPEVPAAALCCPSALHPDSSVPRAAGTATQVDEEHFSGL